MNGMKLPDRYVATGETFKGGGMSCVSVYQDTHLEREVLIKFLQGGVDPARLMDELAALSNIRSKHVVQIYDVARNNQGEIVGIIEELIRGNDLFSLPPPNGLPEFLRISYSIASGISDIHSHDVVHRDIKPNNMKYDSEGCLKIFDFGLARFSGKNSATQAIVGTPGFMAPELYPKNIGEEIGFDKSIDVYAFACSIIFISMGQLPASLKKMPPVIDGSFSFSHLPYAMPPNLVGTLDSCLSNNREERPSMHIVRDELARYLLENKHRALVVAQNNKFLLDNNSRKVSVNKQGMGGFELTYTGVGFVINPIAGDVYVNNIRLNSLSALEGSCVVVLGRPEYAQHRISISIDISHPEVVL